MILTWEECKKLGSNHYKTQDVEPIDLYKSQGTLRHYSITSIMKYASRNVDLDQPVSIKDMNKIIHCAEMLKTVYGGKEE
jgi:hypothetical protein